MMLVLSIGFPDMGISYFDEIPDVETYHKLRLSVDWPVFCKEQSDKALGNSCLGVVVRLLLWAK